VRRLAVSLGTKAQGMSEAGVLWSIVRMLSFVIIGIVGFGTMMLRPKNETLSRSVRRISKTSLWIGVVVMVWSSS
jgi:hypothetical protein